MNGRSATLFALIAAVLALASIAWRASVSGDTEALAGPEDPRAAVRENEATPLVGPERDARGTAPESGRGPASTASRRLTAVVEGAALDASSTGSIRGTVIDEHGLPVTRAAVSCRLGSEREDVAVDTDGAFFFGALSPGRYQLMVEPRSLAGRFLPPWRQQDARPGKDPTTGFGGTDVFLTEGAHEVARLRVFRPARASGQVVDTDGLPVSNAFVHLASTDGVVDAGVTAGDGEYVVERMYPGRYTASVLRVAGKVCGANAAPPISFTLHAGESSRLPDLVSGSGRLALVGRVVDTDGQPIGGVRVEARDAELGTKGPLWRASTDGEGRYELGGLLATRIVVTFAEDTGTRTRWQSPAPAPIEPLEVDLRFSTGRVDRGDTLLERRSPFVVSGRIEVDDAWARSRGFLAFDVRIVSGAPGAAARVAEREPLRNEGAYRAPDRSFTWSCPTPSEPLELAVILTAPGGETVQRDVALEPRPGERESLVVSFP